MENLNFYKTKDKEVLNVEYLFSKYLDIDLDDYTNGPMSANTWYNVSIPLSDFGTTSTVTGFSALRDTTGTLTFDNIKLVTGDATSTNVSYTYDATGQRIGKSVNGTPTTQYVNAGSEHVIQTKDLTTSNTTTFLYGSDLISEGGASASSRRYPLTDGEGNVRYLTDNTGTITASFTYDPYGNMIEGNPTDSTFSFQGEQTDPESGLTYLHALFHSQSLFHGSFGREHSKVNPRRHFF
jgi:YD repeat-containing protein